MAELDKTALHKITRDDIYRQRVFGNKSGKSDFIKVDDKRKLTKIGLVVYLIFIYTTLTFTWDRILIGNLYHVNNAIVSAVEKATYTTVPTPKRWADVEEPEDLRQWLLFALPAAVSPAVQGLVYPLGSMRFTLRRVKSEPNPEARFANLAPRVWIDKNGISTDQKDPGVDDRNAFGSYRVWASNTARTQDVGLLWCSTRAGRCPAESVLLDAVEMPGETAAVEGQCRQWCAELQEETRVCRCFEQVGSTCRFFFVPPPAISPDEDGGTRGLSCGLTGTDINAGDADLVFPNITQDTYGDSVAHYPLMKQFMWNREAVGWKKTPGFVNQLRYWTTDEVTSYIREYESSLGGDPSEWKDLVPMTPGQIIHNQIHDWIEGGMLSRGTAGLAVDFVTYNSHYKVFSWVQLTFELQASGIINKQMQTTSLSVDPYAQKEKSIFAELSLVDILYIALVGCYVLVEFWELGQKLSKYFSSAWNWLGIASLLLHIATLITRHLYLQETDFDSQILSSDAASDSITTMFEAKVTSYRNFVWTSSLNLLLLWIVLVHYLSDIFPRVRVLVDTMNRALTPIVFLMIVIADAFIGFVLWSNLMYGKSVQAFSSFGSAMTACTELLFGQVDTYFDLQKEFPVSGSVFFIVYMMLFFFIFTNLSKAVVLVSYDDASEGYDKGVHQEEQTRRARQSEGNNEWFAKMSKAITHKITHKILKRLRLGKKGHQVKFQQKSHTYSASETCLFSLFVIFYVIMSYYMIQIGWSNQLTKSITQAIEEPTFEKVNRMSGEISHGNSFATIESREDVSSFLAQVLPRAMFNSSAGSFDGQPNPLKMYESALPENYSQLVINNWNILIGQEPVRISTRYFRQDDPEVIYGQAIPTQARSRIIANGVFFLPPIQEADSPNSTKAQGALERSNCQRKFAYAAASTTSNESGYSCMLSVDYENTTTVLHDLADNEFVNEQTAIVVVDFVVYNGFAEAFVYVAIVFEFQPSGTVEKHLETLTVRLNNYSGNLWYRLGLEVLVMIFAAYYLLQSFRGMFEGIREDLHNDKAEGSRQMAWKMWLALRAILRYLLLDPFNALDFISSLMTIVTMGFWYDVATSPLAQNYYFSERPVWDDSCPYDWCADDKVIHKFYWAGWKLQVFIQICAVNTVMVFFRLLKYLQAFPSIRLMFNTFRRGIKDLIWFIIAMSVILMGYVCVGHQLFGDRVEGFSDMFLSVLACFEMFLGTYTYSSLRTTEPFAYFFFSYTYVVVFKYMLINMFFAIVDKHYHKEISSTAFRHLEKVPKEPMARRFGTAVKMLVKGEGLQAAKASFRGTRSISSLEGPRFTEGRPLELLDSPRSPPASEHSPTKDHLALAIVETPGGDSMGSRMFTPSSPTGGLMMSPTEQTLKGMTSKTSSQLRSQMLGSEDMGSSPEEQPPPFVKPPAGKNKNCYNWHVLPEDTQDWALKESATIAEFIDQQSTKRRDGEKVKEQTELDRILQEAEEDLKKRRKDARKAAEASMRDLKSGQLMRLKEIHQDQESLAWYIMKREAELKNLEEMKKMKQDRFERMVQAATSLIRSEDEQAQLALESSNQ